MWTRICFFVITVVIEKQHYTELLREPSGSYF